MPCSTRAKHFYGMNAFREDLDYDLHELDPRVARQGATVRRPLRPSCNDLALWLGRSRVATRARSIGRACTGGQHGLAPRTWVPHTARRAV
jgi:hypothetical protein